MCRWREFQHYHTRNAPWVKLYATLREDPEWRNLDPNAAKLLVDLWCLASKTLDGRYHHAINRLAYDLRRSDVDQLARELQTLASVEDMDSGKAKWIELSSNYLASCYQDACIEERRDRGEQRKNNSPTAKSWVSPYCQAWVDRMGDGSKAPMGRIMKSFGDLHKEYGQEEVLQRWQYYLSETEPRFCKPETFAQAFGQYDGNAPADLEGDFGF